MTPLPYEPPEPESRRTLPHAPTIPTIVYKIVGVILLALLIYWLWRTYTHLPPARPIQYPAVGIIAALTGLVAVMQHRKQ